jgi:hypothetical protein
MHSSEEHIVEAEANEKFSDIINKNDELKECTEKVNKESWIITAKFYSALHHIDAVLVDSGINPEDHRERGSYVDSNQYFNSTVTKLYFTLKDLSEQSRYECSSMNPGQVNSADIALSRLKSELNDKV